MIYYPPIRNMKRLKREAEELLEQITPLPWVCETYLHPGERTVIQGRGCTNVLSIGKLDHNNRDIVPLRVADMDILPYPLDLNIKEEDMRYIICACNLLPRLLIK